jgi:hypothetical protein
MSLRKVGSFIAGFCFFVVLSTWFFPKQWATAQTRLKHWFEKRAAYYSAKLQARHKFMTGLFWFGMLILFIICLGSLRTSSSAVPVNNTPVNIGLLKKAQATLFGWFAAIVIIYFIFEFHYSKMYWSHGQRISTVAVKKLSVEDSLRNSIGMVAGRLRDVLTFFLG